MGIFSVHKFYNQIKRTHTYTRTQRSTILLEFLQNQDYRI